ncbi:MAG: MG2 domain-containing protein [Alistipes indistinctus]
MYEKGIAEKLYLQLDKPYYSAGENIWFKGYLVNAVTLAPMRQSRYIYVELIDRNNTVQQRIKIRADEHGFHNCLKLPPETPRGQYTLRAYTQWMRNSGKAFFYNRILTIGNPIDNAVSATIRYTTEENRQCTAEIVFTDSEKKPIADQKLTYLLALDGKTKRYSAQTTQRGKLLVGFPIPQQDMASNSLTVTIDDPNMPYEKQFIIPAFSQDYSVDFFPEGGHLLPLGMQTVAFKAIGTNGLSVEVNGQIVDGEGIPVTTFNTIHKGMGRLSFRAAERETILCRNPRQRRTRQTVRTAPRSPFGMYACSNRAQWLTPLPGNSHPGYRSGETGAGRTCKRPGHRRRSTRFIPFRLVGWQTEPSARYRAFFHCGSGYRATGGRKALLYTRDLFTSGSLCDQQQPIRRT